MTLRFTVFVVALLVASASDAAESGNAGNGKQLFEAKGCYSCHGFVGQGSREGPRLVPVIALPAFEAQLRTPRQIMPPFTEAVVSDREVADIHAYLAALPRPPDPKTIDLLK